MRFLISLLLVNIGFLSLSSSLADDRREQLLGVINEELVEVVRLSNQLGNSKPKLLLRMAELLLEKARLLKEKENDQYLALSVEARKRANKQSYFKNSRQYFEKAQKTCILILKKFRTFGEKGHVYYILAFNSKEFGQDDKALNYFKLAIKNTKSNSPINIKSKLALAELYYNQGKYQQAIPNYENALRGQKDKWWTKDAYNLAWCYFRTTRYDDAVSTMKEVYNLSKSKDYIDMSAGVMKDIAYFYAEMGQPKEAVNFYEKSGGDVSQNLLRVAKHLLNTGKFTSAEKILMEALNHKKTEKDDVEIQMSLLGLYERFGKIDKHLNTAKKLQTYHAKKMLEADQVEELTIQIQKMSAVLQKQVVGKTYANLQKERLQKAKWAVEYMRLLAILKNKKSYEFNLAAADTLYSSGQFDKAIELYNVTYEDADTANNTKIKNLALEGMMATLGRKGLSSDNRKKYLLTAYGRYVKRYPNSQKSAKIYQRLFSMYFDAKKLDGAEKVLLAYKSNFAADRGTQEVMLGKIIDFHKAKKDHQAVSQWIDRIKTKEFNVSPGYAQKLDSLVLNMQFDQVEKANVKGDKKGALKGYIEIYNDPKTTKEAKKNAAYNVTVLYHEMGDIRRAYDWSKRALAIMDLKDVLQFESSFLTIAAELFDRGRSEDAVEVYENFYNKFCKLKKANKKVFFKNAYVIYLAEGKTEEARSLVEKAQQCDISIDYINEARLDILSSLLTKERWNAFVEELSHLSKFQNMWPRLIQYYFVLYNQYNDSGRSELANKVKMTLYNYYQYCKKRRMEVPLAGLNAITYFKLQDLEIEAKRLDEIKLAFPENVYNDRLKAKFGKLDQVTSRAIDVLGVGSGHGIVKGYQILVKSYDDMADQIIQFTPPDKGKEYIESFKKSMLSLAGPIKQKAREYETEARKQILNNVILSTENHWFLTKFDNLIRPEHQLALGGVTMDRGGKR